MSFYFVCEVNANSAPDRTETLGSEIPPDFVVSRKNDGTPLSRFKDPNWNLKPYGASATWSFTSWHKGSSNELSECLTQEIKTILWLAMFSPVAAKRATKVAGFAGFFLVLRALAQIAHYCNVSLAQAHTNPKFQVALKSSFSAAISDKHAKVDPAIFKGVLRTCHTMKHNPEVQDLPQWQIVPEEDFDNWMAKLTQRARHEREKAKRTPLIPTRIFASLLIGIEEELDTILPQLDNIVAFYSAIYEDPALFASADRSSITRNKERIARSGRPRPKKIIKPVQRVSKEETLRRFHLDQFFKAEGVQHHLTSINSYLAKKRDLASVLIHLYSGMRRSEVQVMPYCCYEEIDVPNFGEVNIIFSHTKKFSKTHYSELMPWVTSPVVKKSIQVAQAIARVNWIKNTPNSFPEEHDAIPLWLGGEWKKAGEPFHYDYPEATIKSDSKYLVGGIAGNRIKQEDIDELVAFDAFRGWDQDPAFAVGKIWPFTTHQARRSVAVYASRSGMVSLPSLSTQFKHLTLMMTALYAENSAFAESFIINKDGTIPDEFGVLTDFRDAQRFNASIDFEEQVIKSQSHLLGGQGKVFQAEKDRNLPRFLELSTMLKEQIRVGQVRYFQLPSGGGCMNETGPCDSYGIDWTFPCYGCSKSVFDNRVLHEAMESLAFSMKAMSPNSLAYKVSEERIRLIQARLI